MTDCTHDLTEREVACADGMCPMCLAARVRELEAERDENASAVRVWKDRLERAEAERDALRALLREAQRYVPTGRYLSGEPLCMLNERINAALGERP